MILGGLLVGALRARPMKLAAFQPAKPAYSERVRFLRHAPSSGVSQRRRRFWSGPHDACELAALEQLAPFAAAPGHLVLRRC